MNFDIERHASTRLEHPVPAPGRPGNAPRWTTGGKTAVGTAVSTESRVWFTISGGVLNEIYFPSIDEANTRSLRFLVADGKNFISEEETGAHHSIRPLASGVPAFRIVSGCKQNRYEIEKEIITDPRRDVLLIRVGFKAGPAEDLRIYVLIDPHVGDCGSNNDAWVGKYKGLSMLFARREESALALACSIGFEQMTCGFAGTSDPWADLSRHKRLTRFYTEATDGNVLLAGQIGSPARANKFSLALGFGGHAAEAGQMARAGLLQEFDSVRDRYIDQWRENQRSYVDFGAAVEDKRDIYRASTGVLQIHESKRFPGAMVAGLSIPWGFDRGDEDIGGYHVVWARDMVQCALGKLACGDAESARRTLFFLKCTQEKNGNWPQNMWLDGTPNWTATQMDGTSFGILLADAIRRANALQERDPWAMIRKAAEFLVAAGPYTEQERWEENAGYSPNTMAVEIAALLAAADFADEQREAKTAEFLRATADAWNESIEELTYASDTALARQHGVPGYYIRISPPEVLQTGLTGETPLQLKNLPADRAKKRAVDVVSPDALGLVRFGLRAADDPRILDTVKVIDATLKAETITGPVWHRYTDDGYGEHEDGRPFDHTGRGRGWPLLAGERAHYEIARRNFDAARRLLNTMAAQTSDCGLLPEQVWDSGDIPDKALFNGRPTGSGMPLAWAHAEYIKLLRSLKEQRVWDMPPQPVERYQREDRRIGFQIWSFTQQRSRLSRGKNLRIDCRDRARVRWSADNWKTVQETETVDSGLAVHYAVLQTADLEPGTAVMFTFFWPAAAKWEQRNFKVSVH